MLKALSVLAIGAFVVVVSPSAQAAPAPGLLNSMAKPHSAVQDVRCRCWWRWGRRHCHCW